MTPQALEEVKSFIAMILPFTETNLNDLEQSCGYSPGVHMP
jgi:hypothetical protein